MKRCADVVLTKAGKLAAISSLMSALTTGDALAAPTCPLSYGTTDASKSHIRTLIVLRGTGSACIIRTTPSPVEPSDDPRTRKF